MAELDSSHYEISVRVGSRWEIHARYPVSQKDAAVDEARDLERAMSAHVKVSRETFDVDSGLYKEIIVYRTAGAPMSGPARPPQRGGGKGGGGGGFRDDDDDGIRLDKDGFIKIGDDDEEEDDEDEFFEVKRRRKRKPKPPRKPSEVTAGGLALRVLLVTLLSFVISGGVTWALSGSQQRLDSLQRIMGFHSPTDVLASVFLTLFILSFLALALVLLSDHLRVGPSIPAGQAGASSASAATAAAPAQTASQAKEEAAGKWLEKLRNKNLVEKEEPLPEEESAVPEESHWEPTPGPEPEPPPPEEPPAPPAKEEPPSEVAEEEIPPTGLSAAALAQQVLLTSFMEMVMRDLAQVAPRMDSSTRFAVCLFVSGAVESLANDKGLPREETAALLRDAVETLGTPPEQAARYAETYESYLLNPRYLEMFEGGRLSVNCFLEGDSEGAHRLAPALESWRHPRKEEQQSQGAVAVMFTDMVGSTDLNQTVGDARAQHVVHTHNRIVRGVLADYYGREVKHTGDGIMASFPNTSNAVKAGIVIMKRVAANNRAEKDLPLTLRIGINVGEPIQENNDLFGVTVQMAARLCAAAQPTQVIVSEAVKAMCAGKDIKFMDRGTRLLKGIPDPVPVFEPVWDPAPAPQQQPPTPGQQQPQTQGQPG